MKKTMVLMSLLFLNSMDLLYLVANKIGLFPGYVYVFIVPIVSFLFYYNYRKYTYRDACALFLLMVYFVLKLIHGLANYAPPEYVFVTFISFSLAIYLVQVFFRTGIEELFELIKSLFCISILFYIFVDFASILIMQKSQHVVLTNNLPFLLLTGAAISISNRTKKICILPLKYLFFYCSWIYISLMYFTSDHRMQLKAVLISAGIIVLFLLIYGVSLFIPRIKRCLSLQVSVPLIVMTACISGCLMIYFIIQYLFNYSIDGRETSIGLRMSVAKLMIKDFLEGSSIDWLFGFGLGSSMQEFPASIGTQIIFLKSHSGLLSLFYEHGIISILLILIMCIKFTIAPTLSVSLPSAKKKHYTIYNILLLIAMFMVWAVLNVIYVIAINVPNYGSQTQMVSGLLLLVFLNRAIYAHNNE